MRASLVLGIAAFAILLGTVIPAGAQARVPAGAQAGWSVSGRVEDPAPGGVRAGARLAAVRAPEAHLARSLTGRLGDVVKRGLNVACGVICVGVRLIRRAKEAVGHVAAGVLDQLAGSIASGGAWMMRKTAHLIDRTTTPALSARWFRERYDQMRRVSVLFALLAFLAAIMAATAARNGQAILATIGVRLPLAFGLAAVLAIVVQLAVEVADNLAADFATSFETNTAVVLRSGAKGLLALVAASGQTGVPGIITIVVSLFAIATSFVLWLEMLVRDAGIYVVVFLAPLACAAVIWERCVPLLTRTLWVLFGLVMSKPLMVALMSLASTGLAHGVTEQGIGGVLVVLVLLFLTCLTPWTLLALVPLLEGYQGHRAARQALMSTPGAMAGTGGRAATQALMQEHFGSGGRSSAGAGVSASDGSGGARESMSVAATSGLAASGGVGAAAGPVAAAVRSGSLLRTALHEAGERQSVAATASGGAAGGPAQTGPARGTPEANQMPAPADAAAPHDGAPRGRMVSDAPTEPSGSTSEAGEGATSPPATSSGAGTSTSLPSKLGAAGGADASPSASGQPPGGFSTGAGRPVEPAKEGFDE